MKNPTFICCPGTPASTCTTLDALAGDNLNGPWKLYIYDDLQPGGIGQLSGSWRLEFDF
jgi:hypothetical protein